MSIIKKLRRNEKGATAIEYGLIAALVAVAAAGVLQTVGGNVKGTFEAADGKLATAAATK
jgi:pilus assembly protein Flp/PilA